MVDEVVVLMLLLVWLPELQLKYNQSFYWENIYLDSVIKQLTDCLCSSKSQYYSVLAKILVLGHLALCDIVPLMCHYRYFDIFDGWRMFLAEPPAPRHSPAWGWACPGPRWRPWRWCACRTSPPRHTSWCSQPRGSGPRTSPPRSAGRSCHSCNIAIHKLGKIFTCIIWLT